MQAHVPRLRGQGRCSSAPDTHLDDRVRPQYFGGVSTAPVRTHRSMTLDEWGDLGEDEPGELVDGVLEEEEMATYRHERAAAWLLARLLLWAERKRGYATGAETKVAVA